MHTKLVQAFMDFTVSGLLNMCQYLFNTFSALTAFCAYSGIYVLPRFQDELETLEKLSFNHLLPKLVSYFPSTSKHTFKRS